MARANHTITGNNSLTTINELALAIETLAESVPDEQFPTIPAFVVASLLEVELVQGGETP